MSQKPNFPLPLPFIDLMSQQKKIRADIEAGFQKVLDHGHYVMGPEIFELESKLSDFCGAKHTLSCANGTDALALILMAKNVGPGDAVFVPTFTFAATAEVVAWVGATAIFTDVCPDTFNMDPESLKQGILTAHSLGLKPTAIIPVDLFGLPADYDALESIAHENNLWILSDAAQSFGATYNHKPVGNFGLATSTSFFPAKPLGCYGDGGAIFTDDDALYEALVSLRVHGQGKDKYDNIHIGMNGRLDTLQAAVLLEKLKLFPEEIKARNKAASFYTSALQNTVGTPYVPPQSTSIWAQYTIRLPHIINRAQLMEHLRLAGIPSVIYYVKPLHHQKAYAHFPTAGNSGLPTSEALCNDVLSLPMHGYLTNEMLEYITHHIITFCK